MLLRQMQIDGCYFEITVTEQYLDGAQSAPAREDVWRSNVSGYAGGCAMREAGALRRQSGRHSIGPW